MARKRKRARKLPQSASVKTVKILFFLLISFMASLSLIGDFSPIVPEIPQYGNNQGSDFIADIAPAAQQMQANYGVHASISIAQAILESDWGESELSAVYNNLYGMKGDNPENTVRLMTSEYYNGEWVTIQANRSRTTRCCSSTVPLGIQINTLLFCRQPLTRKRPRLSRIAVMRLIRIMPKN